MSTTRVLLNINTFNTIVLMVKFFDIYSNGHCRELCLEIGGEILTNVVYAVAVNPIHLGGGGRSSKNLNCQV